MRTWSPFVLFKLVVCWQSIVSLFLPQRCFPKGAPSFASAKSFIHLPPLETLELSILLLDSFSLHIPASYCPILWMDPFLSSPSFQSKIPSTFSWSRQEVCLPIPVPSLSSLLPRLFYIKHRSGHVFLLFTDFS